MRHYMQTLRERGEIIDVDRAVDPKHELAAVTQAAMRRWNKPIRRGYPFAMIARA